MTPRLLRSRCIRVRGSRPYVGGAAIATVGAWVLGVAVALVPMPGRAVQITDAPAGLLMFDPSKGETVSISFKLLGAGVARVEIYDSRDLLVRTLAGGLRESGPNTLVWDGRDDWGRSLPPNVYRYVIAAADDMGEVRYDLSDSTGGQALEVEGATWDPVAGVVRYTVPRPAQILIGIGLARNGPLLRTLLDWVPRDAGSHEEPWDGTDASGTIPMGEFQDLEFRTEATRLSRNSILVLPEQSRPGLLDIEPSRQQRRPVRSDVGSSERKRGLRAAAHQRAVPIRISVPSDVPRNSDGLPILRGQTPINVDVEGPVRQSVINHRFEIGFYIDGSYVFENEVAFLPTSWVLDPARLSAGRHYVTSNLWVYEGGIGTNSLEFVVEHR